MNEAQPRRATHDDVDGIRRLVADAFGKYVDRIGKPPAPMTADYAELIDTSRVWVIEQGSDVVGVLVTQAQADHLLLDSVAVARRPRAAATGGPCWSGPIRTRASRGCRKSGCAPTRR